MPTKLTAAPKRKGDISNNNKYLYIDTYKSDHTFKSYREIKE